MKSLLLSGGAHRYPLSCLISKAEDYHSESALQKGCCGSWSVFTYYGRGLRWTLLRIRLCMFLMHNISYLEHKLRRLFPPLVPFRLIMLPLLLFLFTQAPLCWTTGHPEAPLSPGRRCLIQTFGSRSSSSNRLSLSSSLLSPWFVPYRL